MQPRPQSRELRLELGAALLQRERRSRRGLGRIPAELYAGHRGGLGLRSLCKGVLV